LISVFKKNQIKTLLELLQSKPSLVKDVPEEELVLRSLHENKIRNLAKPRENLLANNKPTPARLKKIIATNMEKPSYTQIVDNQLIAFRPRSVSYHTKPKVEKGSSNEPLTEADYYTKQVFARNQQELVANTTIEHLFSRGEW
jgi:hypothetical protein